MGLQLPRGLTAALPTRAAAASAYEVIVAAGAVVLLGVAGSSPTGMLLRLHWPMFQDSHVGSSSSASASP